MPGAKCHFCAMNTFRENLWTNRQTNKQTNKLDQSQDIVTGNAFISSEKIVQKCNIDLISAYLPGNSDLHNSSRSNVTLTYQCHIANMR